VRDERSVTSIPPATRRGGERPERLHRRPQILPARREGCHPRLGTRDHDAVDSTADTGPHAACDLPPAALDAVALHRAPDLSGNCEAEPGRTSVSPIEDPDRRRAAPYAPALPEHPFELCRLLERREARQTPRGTADASYADSLTRPFRRRRPITSLPERVRIRTRNPWVFCRARFFGWNVRFIGRSNPPSPHKDDDVFWSGGWRAPGAEPNPPEAYASRERIRTGSGDYIRGAHLGLSGPLVAGVRLARDGHLPELTRSGPGRQGPGRRLAAVVGVHGERSTCRQ
jgi:hypothetical protein